MSIVYGTSKLREDLSALESKSDDYAVEFVELLLRSAQTVEVSDIHIQPTEKGLDLRWRIDGVLQFIGNFPIGERTDPITRLKVLAELLTYRQDIPQEGRLRDGHENLDMRISTFPTLRGERAVVRLFAKNDEHFHLSDLGLSKEIESDWQQHLHGTSGALLICGAAGSGKTTSAYASLRQIANDSSGGRSIVTIEDPIEVEISGVAQSQVNATSGFTMTTGLRSLLRQDPEVIFVGEVRDPDAAKITFQAALTGQLAISTFHANSAAAAISRLADMNIEPYVLCSGIRAILHQRLVRRLCDACKSPIEQPADLAGWDVARRDSVFRHVGCKDCHGTGYRGRILLAELLVTQQGTSKKELLARADVTEIESIAVAQGMVPIAQRAIQAIMNGTTSPAEARRVVGFVD